MEKQVIFRDRQELQSADLNHIGEHAAAAMKHIVQDAVSDGLHYTGGVVTARSATEVDVAALRFFNGGKVYASEQVQTVNLFAYLPLTTQRCVAVVIWGEEVETNVEPRDFLVDLTTNATEPQAVAMQRTRLANINLQPGTESVDPQPPAIQSATLAIAYVYLTPTGIDRIEMQSGFVLPNLKQQDQRLFEQEAWRSVAEPRISSIATDLAALGRRTDSLVQRDTVVEMANDIARLKSRLNLPTAYASYESDYFGNASKTNAAGVGYAAAVDNGLLFPTAAQAKVGLALFNPYESAVSRSAADLVLPAYKSVPRIQANGYSGDISISQYQVQEQRLREYTTTVTEQKTGYRYNYYSGWWGNYYWNYYPHRYYYISSYQYSVTRTETHYELENITTSYSGALIAQSFLCSNAMWLTEVGLFFTQVGASGDVQVLVCETDAGRPNLEKTLSRVTVTRNMLKRYPTETRIPMPPALLQAGGRYALVLITQGDHRAATVSGDSYTQGTLFFGTDGDYFTGDLTKDLMFTLYAAQFNQPRIEVMLQSISLAGGISDLEIAAPQIVPDGTELVYEAQVAGKWYPLPELAAMLGNVPDIVPLRAVMLGTTDLAPALKLTPEAITGSRPATGFTHWANERILAANTSSVTVQVVVAQWDTAHHALNCALISGANTYTPATTVTRDEPDGLSKRITFTFTPPAINRYSIKLTGTRSAGSKPFVVVERTDVAT
ncbi:hypothetical protein [Comamonas resistens]|uniref:hypothetical protein n=1 Tax=Comamonas resistens TaxID=3046670 RepID=UPI0039BD7EA5